MDNPKVIVVAETEVHELLVSSGVHWDVQHPVESVSQMWDDLSAGRLDQQSVAIVFSDSTFAGRGDLEQAIATMAAHAATFVVAWDGEGVDGLLARVRETSVAHGGSPEVPVHVLPAVTGRSILDGMRRVLETAPPPRRTVFPDAYPIDVDEPMQLSAPQVHEFAPEPVAQVPAPAPPLHLVEVPGVSAAPAHALYPQPTHSSSVDRAPPAAPPTTSSPAPSASTT